MHSLKKTSLVTIILAAFLLAGCGLSLAEDVTPPPNYRPPQQQAEQPVISETVFPILPPDPAQGKALYAEKCLPCHGESGMGDGPQAANLPYPAAPIGSIELARESRPVDWFRTVTIGNLERLMPGFSGSLSDRQRWDVVAYVYTLSTKPQELAQGQEIYEAECADCHGQDGKGGGPKAAELSIQPASWKDQSRLAERSASDLVAMMMTGNDQMHAYGGQYDAAQLYSVAAYIRTLSYADSALPAQVAQAEAQAQPTAEDVETTPQAQTTEAAASTPAVEGTPVGSDEPAASADDQQLSSITVTGKITNGTPGGTVPEGLEVELAAFADMAPAFEISVPAAPDGSYRFEDVDFDPSYVYFARVTSGDLTFNSDILHGKDVLGQEVDLPVQIYDTTTDASALKTDRLHVFFDFTQPGRVQVVNLYVISNPSGRVVTAAGAGQPVVTFDLPQGASNLQFEDSTLGQRYVQTANGFGDTVPVQPGPMGVNQILFAYDLPYENALTFNMTMPLDVEAATVMIPTAGVELSSNQLIDQGAQTAQGMSFRTFQAVSSFAAGDTLELNLKGAPGAEGAQAGSETLTPLLIGLGVFGAALAGLGYWLYRRRQSEAEETLLAAEGEDEVILEAGAEEDSESILDAIIALDDRHAAGELPEGAYQERRAALKAQLAEALARENTAKGADAA